MLDQRLGARGPRREGLDQPAGEVDRASYLSCPGEVLDLRERPPVRALALAGRREAKAVPREPGGDVEGSSRARASGGFLEQARHGRVRLVGREGEVACPHVRVRRPRSQPAVERATVQLSHPPVHGRADERMREAHLEVLLHDEEPVLPGDGEQPVDVRVGQDPPQLRDRGRSER